MGKLFQKTLDKTSLIGKKYGKLTVISFSHTKLYDRTTPTRSIKSTQHYWLCKCECGNEKAIQTSHLRSGSTVSCGCHREKINKEKGYTLEEIRKLVNSFPREDNGCKYWPGKAVGKDGYPKISYKNKTWRASRLVYLAFHGKIPEDQFICHDCDDRKCIEPAHLHVGTAKDNMQEAAERNRLPTGTKHHSAKLNEDKVRYIRKNAYLGTTELGRQLDVSHKTIERILTGRTWRHVK